MDGEFRLRRFWSESEESKWEREEGKRWGYEERFRESEIKGSNLHLQDMKASEISQMKNMKPYFWKNQCRFIWEGGVVLVFHGNPRRNGVVELFCCRVESEGGREVVVSRDSCESTDWEKLDRVGGGALLVVYG